jgi:four helix bundle protein
MQDFRKLNVWERAHRLTLDLYRMTRTFPNEERYGLTSQIRRSASSIGANLAEGCGRRGDREFRRFLVIALGSASELEYHLLLAADLGYVHQEQHAPMAAEVTGVKRMLSGLMNSLDSNGR